MVFFIKSIEKGAFFAILLFHYAYIWDEYLTIHHKRCSTRCYRKEIFENIENVGQLSSDC